MTDRRQVLERAAEQVLARPLRIWGFGEGHALLGLVAAADLLDRPDLLAQAVARVEPSLSRGPSPEDHLIAVDVLRQVAARVPGLQAGPALKRWRDAITTASRPVPGRPAVHRPDLCGLGRLIWVDCLHTDGPGLAALGGDGAALVAENAAVLQGSGGLFHHGYDVVDGRPNGVHWGRGQGWALWGLVGTLALQPSPELTQRLAALLDALARHEEAGCWRTIVDDPGAPVENSVSALVAAGILAGLVAGVVPPQWADLGRRALDAACAATAADGGLEVSEATPVGSPVTYLSRRSGVFPWGQGPLLVALAAAEGWNPFAEPTYDEEPS